MNTLLYKTFFHSMPCARSLTLIFSDDGRFDYFRFDYVLADLYCCATSVTLNVWLLLPIRNYCQLSHFV